MDAAELTRILRGHYLPPNRPAGGLFAVEVGSPCGRRRADALWLPLTRAGGTGLVGHELKVSRSDVMAELADPTKAEPWSQYCDRWWLTVSDPSLVEGLDIPEAWGIMSPPSGRRTRSMTVLRPAPKLRPMEPALGLRRLLGWNFYASEEKIHRAQVDLDYHKREVERLRRELAEARANGATQGNPHSQRVGRIIHETEKRLSQEQGIWGSVDEAAVIDAIVDAESTRHAAANVRRQLQNYVHRIEDLIDPLKWVRRDLDNAVKAGEREMDEVAAS